MDFSTGNHHHTTKSLQNLFFYPAVVYFHTYTVHGRSKSLPNIFIVTSCESELSVPSTSLLNQEGSLLLVKKHSAKPKILKKTWDKVKTVIHNTTSSQSNRRGSLRNKTDKACSSRSSCVSSAPSTPIQKATFDFEANPSMTNFVSGSGGCDESLSAASGGCVLAYSSPGDTADTDSTVGIEETEKIQRNYAKLQKRLSEELHQRMSEYKPEPNRHSTDNLSDDFKKRLQQWEMWKVSTGKVTYTEEELQQILPEDFSRKLHEWECIKTSGVSPHHQGGSGHTSSGGGGGGGRQHSKTPDSYLGGVSPSTFGASSPEVPTSIGGKSKLLRKKKNTESSRQKELAWLEKQLEKIEAEKKRLEREMKKYNEREARLEKMKEALQNTNANELWIRTPTAKCKVEKITEKFTKKLYEWEEKQGIQPESSTMALLHPKYFGPPPGEDDEEPGGESCCSNASSRPITGHEEFMDATFEHFQDEVDEVCRPQQSSFTFGGEGEIRQSCQQSRSDECVFAIPQEQMQMSMQMQAEEMRQVSSASSSDFEEATDSFATHDKGNSGASNTDSDFYRAEFPGSRRRSSEAISTPLSARSPSLSAFTSDDEGEMYGLLKTVCEEESETLNNTLKDAESQTEVILKAKPIHVLDDPEDNYNESGEGGDRDEAQSGAGIFVQTKRTIFTPILADEMIESEKVVLIEQDLRSPSLVKSLIRQSQPTEGGGSPSAADGLSSEGNSNQSSNTEDRSEKRTTSPLIIGNCPQRKDEELQSHFTYSSSVPGGGCMYYGMNSPLNLPDDGCRTPPRIVEVIPKLQHSNTMPKQYPNPVTATATTPTASHQFQVPQPQQSNSPQRTFPKMGKVPIWCSPLGSRRYLGGSGISAGAIGASEFTPHYSRSHSTSIDFTSDARYLADLEDQQDNDAASTINSSRCVCTSASTGRIPSVTPRLYRRNTSAAVIEESGLIGANVQTGQRHPAILLPARSSSFRFRREPSEQDMRSSNFRTRQGQVQQQVQPQQGTGNEGASSTKGLYTQLKNRVGSVVTVTKSQSTGSIRSKLGKAFTSLTHKITGDRDHNSHAKSQQPSTAANVPANASGSLQLNPSCSTTQTESEIAGNKSPTTRKVAAEMDHSVEPSQIPSTSKKNSIWPVSSSASPSHK